MAPGPEPVSHARPGGQHAAPDVRVLVEDERAVAAARRSEQPQPPRAVRLGERALLVSRLDAGPVRDDPDLQEVHGLLA